MRVCPVCQTRFKDTTVTCRYCGVSLEQMTPPSSTDKKAVRRRHASKGKKATSVPVWQTTLRNLWKKYWYWVYIILLLIIVVYAGFTFLSPHKNVIKESIHKTIQPLTRIENPYIQGPAQPISTAPSSVSNATNTPTAYDWFNNAFKLCPEGKCTDLAKVVEYLDYAIRLKPDYAEAFNNRGVAYLDLGESQLAIDDYNEAIRLKPQRAEFFNNRGIAYAKMGDIKRSIEDYDQAILLKQNYTAAYNNRGTAYRSLKQYQTAIDNYNEAIRLKPNHVDLYANRGMTYLDMENKIAGCSDLSKACELGNCESLEKAKSNGMCP